MAVNEVRSRWRRGRLERRVLLVDLDGDVVTRTVRVRPTGGWHDVDSTNARILDVGSTQGEMALGGGWEVTWQPSPGVTATLTADIDDDELLRLAETVAPVPADDARFAGIWGLIQ